MRAAFCVGRVGGLAVAIGVGAAVATGGVGVAWASGPDDTSVSDASADHAGPRRGAGHASQQAPHGNRPHDHPGVAKSARAEKPTVKTAQEPEPEAPAPVTVAGPADTQAATGVPPAVPAEDVATTAAATAPRPPVPVPPARLVAAPAAGTVQAVPGPYSTGGVPVSPDEATAGWLVLAAVRRSGRPQAAATTAAQVSTGQVLAPRASAKAANPFAALFANQTPTLAPSLAAQGPTGVITGSLNTVDPDGDSVTYSLTGKPAHGSVQVDSGGRFTYTPEKSAAHTGVTDSFTVTVSDANSGFHIHGISGWLNLVTFGLLGQSGHTSTRTVGLTITPVNAAPTGTLAAGPPDPATGAVSGRVTGADSDGDPLSYKASGATKGAVVVAADGGFTYTPTAAARHGAARLGAGVADKADTFAITVSDGQGGTAVVPVSVTVSPANAAPVASVSVGVADSVTGAVAGAITVSDADGDPLSFASPGTAKGVLTIGPGGAFTYRPTAEARHQAAAVGANPTDTVTVTVSDGYGGSVSVPVTVTIVPANAVPVVAPVAVGAPDPANGVVTGTVKATDADSDPLSYKASGAAKGTAIIGSDGALVYTPTATARHAAAKLTAAAGDKADMITVTVSDGHGGTVSVPVSVVIGPRNAVPVATASAGTPDAVTGVVAGAILGTDADADALSYLLSGSASKGSVVLSPSGGYTYTPTALARHEAATAASTDSFVVTVADGYGGTVDVPVTVSVAPASVTFNFVYGSGSQYWTPEARAALESAASRLASSVVVSKPVTLSYDVVGDNTPGSGFVATSFAKFSSASPGYYGTVVQTKLLTGNDPNGTATDSQIAVNFAYPWALGDTVTGSQYDFQAVATHELLHTFGVMTGLGSPSSIDRNWTTYDSFLSTADGTRVIGADYVWNTAYTPNLTGGAGGLYFNGPHAVAAYGGPVPLYTPSAWKAGASLTHLDPAKAPPGTTYLMDPADGYGPGVRVVSPVEAGLLTDLGYTLV